MPGTFKRRLIGPHPALEVAVHVLDHDDGVVDHEADRNRQRHQRKIIDRETGEPHAGASPGQSQRHRDACRDGRREPAQECEHHQHDQERGRQQRPLHILDAGTDGPGTIDKGGDFDGAGNPLPQFGYQCLDAINGVDDVGVALLGNLDQNRRLLVEPGDRPAVADGILYFRDIREPDEATVRAFDQDFAEFGGRPHLPVNRQGFALATAIEDAHRAQRVGIDDRESDIIGGNSGIGERDRIERNPNRGLVGAADGDFADARDLRDALRDHRIRHVINRVWRYRLRRQRQHEYRRRRGIGFAEARQARQVARQIGERGVDRGLHVTRGPIDVAADGKLQLNAGRTQRACGCDLFEARDLAKLAFQGRGNGRRHHRRVGARPRREHADHRKVDIGNGGHGQKLVGDPADQKEPDRQQGGTDRTADEGLRDRCHYCIPSVAPATGGPAGPGSGTAFSILRLSRSSAR